MKSLYYFFVFFYLGNVSVFGYNFNNNKLIQQDSLSNYSFEILEEKYKQSLNKKSSIVYAKAYLNKAKVAKTFNAISKGFYLLLKASERKEMLLYSDSLLLHYRDRKKTHHAGLAYYMKGTEYYINGDLSEALNWFVIADEILQNEETVEERLWPKQAIAVIKQKTGDIDGALKEFLFCLNEYEKKEQWENYGYSAYSTYVLYVEQKKIDSANYFVDKALAKINKDSKIYPRLKYSKGVIAFKDEKFDNAVELFKESSRALDSIEDVANLAFSQSYLGESYLRITDTVNGMFYLEKAGDFLKSDSITNSGVRSAIMTLADIYKKRNDLKRELVYVKQLITIDSINSEDRLKLKDSLFLKYEIPEAVKRKNQLINRIKKDNDKILIVSIITFLLLVGLAVLFFHNKRKSKKKIRSYEKIIEEYKANFPKKTSVKHSPQIPDRDVNILKKAFQTYDKEKHYVKQSFNKEYVKKHTGINDHYISDFLRDYVGMSLIQYINDKRIEYAIKKIMEDANYSKYTMAAMAEEVGYSSSATFKRVFQKRTGLTPLEFIKKHNNS